MSFHHDGAIDRLERDRLWPHVWQMACREAEIEAPGDFVVYDGALWYRMRPNGDDHDSSIVDIWSLGRFAPGREPEVRQEVFHGFEAFRGQCEFLEEDFSNIAAVNRGVKSRGFRAPMLNPVQEVGVVHFHAMLAKFLRADGG